MLRRCFFLTSTMLCASLAQAADRIPSTREVKALPAGTGVAQAAPTVAKRPEPAPVHDQEQLIVTGTRDRRATARQSLSAISVVTNAQLRQSGAADLRDALTQLAPSISRQPVGYGNANMIDTINMRGLTSNQTLILVNGKRRDPTAIFYNNPGPQFGTTPVDISMLPSSAIDHVEILQDGAAAQYGSDAIAGVVNLILKRNNKGLTVDTNNGGYYAGDGFTSNESANYGTDLNGRGFFSISGEFKFQDHTDRTPATPDGARNNHILGNPRELRQSIGYNMQYDLLPELQLYSFSTYAHRNAESFQYYRPGTGSNALPSIYPQGYSPQEANDENDFGVTVGLKGHRYFDWDLSSTYGEDINHAGMFESGNTSLYALYGTSPTTFHQNTQRNSQWTTNFDLKHSYDTGILAGPINLSFGAEYRYETWQLLPGDPASYFGSGTQAQYGTSPANSVSSHRNVTGGYVDVGTTLLPHWRIDLAGRYEHYTNSEDTENGKISSRYDVSSRFAVRGTVSNGFRAPTLAESNYTNTSVLPSSVSGVFSPNSAAARSLGAIPLKPERSTNFSAGVVFTPLEHLHVTIDGYQVSIRDRIVQGGRFNGARAIAALAAAGITVPSSISPSAVSAVYFTNGASTKTRGADISAQYLTQLGRLGRIDWDASLNLNDTKITRLSEDSSGNAILTAQQQAYLTSYFPKNKLIFGGVWHYDRYSLTVHEIRYGHGSSSLTYYYGPLAYSNTQFLRYTQTPRYQTDIQAAWDIDKHWRVALGGINVGNEKPRKLPANNQYNHVLNRDIYYQGIGINGGYYYFQASARF